MPAYVANSLTITFREEQQKSEIIGAGCSPDYRTHKNNQLLLQVEEILTKAPIDKARNVIYHYIYSKHLGLQKNIKKQISKRSNYDKY